MVYRDEGKRGRLWGETPGAWLTAQKRHGQASFWQSQKREREREIQSKGKYKKRDADFFFLKSVLCTAQLCALIHPSLFTRSFSIHHICFSHVCLSTNFMVDIIKVIDSDPSSDKGRGCPPPIPNWACRWRASLHSLVGIESAELVWMADLDRAALSTDRMRVTRGWCSPSYGSPLLAI